MIDRLRNRVAKSEGQGGFTLIELLVVIIIIGILLAVAVPSYLSFRDRANNSAAQANLRAIVPSMESYYADNNAYTGMTLANLKSTYDQALDTSKYALSGTTASAYCMSSASGKWTAKKTGPASQIATSSASGFGC